MWLIELLEALADGFSGGGSRDRRNGHNYKGSVSCKHCGKIAFLVVAAIVAGMIYIQPQWGTEEVVKKEARLYCHETDYTGAGKDSWDNDLRYEIQEIENEKTIASECTVTSAGRDGKFGTGDDIVATDRNIHVAKVVAREVGEGTKQFFKGLIDGLKSDEQPAE